MDEPTAADIPEPEPTAADTAEPEPTAAAVPWHSEHWRSRDESTPAAP